MLPTEIIKDFIGKVCSITTLNSSFGVVGKIEEVENNWMRVVDEKGKIRLINGDMVSAIEILSEKYQKKYSD